MLTGEFPDETTITTPAAEARRTAVVEGRAASRCVAASDMLITRAPLATAQSIPRATSDVVAPPEDENTLTARRWLRGPCPRPSIPLSEHRLQNRRHDCRDHRYPGDRSHPIPFPAQCPDRAPSESVGIFTPDFDPVVVHNEIRIDHAFLADIYLAEGEEIGPAKDESIFDVSSHSGWIRSDVEADETDCNQRRQCNIAQPNHQIRSAVTP